MERQEAAGATVQLRAATEEPGKAREGLPGGQRRVGLLRQLPKAARRRREWTGVCTARAGAELLFAAWCGAGWTGVCVEGVAGSGMLLEAACSAAGAARSEAS